jgi:hypothetical protein
MNFCMTDAVCAVGVVHALSESPLLGGGVQQLNARRLVRDQGVHPVGIAGGQVEPNLRTATAAQHIGGFAT